ncbi:hypothetical protein SLI_7829 [Streptomyces lividans 1326]|uniref:Uncharacterized protein n=1 Tax=Streptomyces lividans 1326 TaxID=1200984 RepID=A0A7U9HF18_STRLI|nr:hypothetical protein SLI_7829 [Streptomyces lividans 1326]
MPVRLVPPRQSLLRHHAGHCIHPPPSTATDYAFREPGQVGRPAAASGGPPEDTPVRRVLPRPQ